MELVDEHLRSYIDEPEFIALLQWLTYGGPDICAAWIGKYQPATRSTDEKLADLARFSREHYFLYLYFVRNWMECRGRVLDIGSGTCQRTSMLSRYSTHVDGVELDPVQARFGGKYNGGGSISLYVGSYPEQFSILDPIPTFDYIFASEIIEHVPLEEQERFIGFSLSILNPGGRMFITCPNDGLGGKPVTRGSPHVGLWGEKEHSDMVASLGPRVLFSGYASVSGLNMAGSATLDSLIVGQEPADHYVLVLE